MLFSEKAVRFYSNQVEPVKKPAPDNETPHFEIGELKNLNVDIVSMCAAEIEGGLAAMRLKRLPNDQEIATVLEAFHETNAHYLLLDVRGLRLTFRKMSKLRPEFTSFLNALSANGVLLVDALVDASGVISTIALKAGPLQPFELRGQIFRFGRIIAFDFDFADDHIRRSIILSGEFYEQQLLDKMAENYQGGNIIDVGANIGNHSVYLGDIVTGGSKVFSFEPFDRAFRLLSRNVFQNDLAMKVRTFQCGVGADKGEANVMSNVKSNLGAARLISAEGAGPVDSANTIRVESLDRIFDSTSPIAIIKIDVEGMEPNVLVGAKNLLSQQSPDVYIEAADDERKNAIEELLVPLGYEYRETFNATPTHWYAKPES